MFTTIVCMKICIDVAQLKADPHTKMPNLKNVPLRISTFDEHVLEEAIQLKEKYGGKVLSISLVPSTPPREIVLKTLAMGADVVYIIKDETSMHADPLATAIIIAAAIRKLESWDIVICGEGSIDQYNAQVGPRIAEALRISSILHVTKVEIKHDRLVAVRALEDRNEIVESEFPVLLTVGQEINQPRLPSVLQIMGSSKKPMFEWQLQDLGFPPGEVASEMSDIVNLEIYAPPTIRKKILIEGKTIEETAKNLARMLFDEGVIK